MSRDRLEYRERLCAVDGCTRDGSPDVSARVGGFIPAAALPIRVFYLTPHDGELQLIAAFRDGCDATEFAANVAEHATHAARPWVILVQDEHGNTIARQDVAVRS
jgi:hypothetical protein